MPFQWRKCDAVPYKMTLQCPKLDVDVMGALPVKKGTVIKCPLCWPYMTVPQRRPFPVEKMGYIAV